MQKVKLTNEKLKEVIKLRKGGAKWLQIQKETSIPRHIAKREYENWERSQSLGELGKARTVVAAEAFRDHINSLIAIAEALTNHLRLPAVTDRTLIADKFLEQLWKINIISTVIFPGVSGKREKNDPLRNHRENQMLLKALVAHTSDTVSWQNLDIWKKSWNECLCVELKLREEALKMIDKYIATEESRIPSLTNDIKEGSVYYLPFDRMADAIIVHILHRLLRNENDEVAHKATKMCKVDETFHVIHSDTDSIILKFNQANLAEVVESVCNRVAKELFVKYEQDVVVSLRIGLRTMMQIKKEFEEKLEPLLIRPAILRTHCDLCPA